MDQPPEAGHLEGLCTGLQYALLLQLAAACGQANVLLTRRKHQDPWTPFEESTMIKAYSDMGSKWHGC